MSCSNACRDARLVRPLQCSGTFASNSSCADAQAVRPYMPRSMQLVHSVHLFIYQLRGVDARAVRPYIAIMGVLRGNGYSACVPDAVG
ncbi:hypothetical protein [Segatella maculosa]|uniref:hypothetical protein n=1 Tax=Segatella maculosa TaxID=439703 RepID=UPI0023F128E7|nr:hypothetical protein [Segatella maculosa]